ncbi:type IV secretion system DNA-binding domain-containing protein [Halospeciosus flavus]|uniref:type IV secretion system DNA-binding domain-containing protein n=1 Tax=Halospeciosus flavus TaxID=3032283 RepID=UPI003622442C
MGSERYGQAVEAPKIIRNHLRALFDPVHGDDAISHTDLYAALENTQAQRNTPATSDDNLEAYFTGLLERDRDVFNRAVGGAVSRVETIATDSRLAPIFEHVPDETGPAFSFADIVDQDAVVIFDFGGMEDHVKRTLTLVLLSNLWTALKARAERTQPTTDEQALVNLYIDEARDLADTRLLDTLLSQGRSFGLAVTLGVQFPSQLDSPDPAADTYREALNETATFVVGNVTVDDDLMRALATDDMPPSEVATRLGAMRRGEWLVRPGTGFGQPLARPFLIRSLPIPAGHPESDAPLVGRKASRFEHASQRVRERTREQWGLTHHGPVRPSDESSHAAADDEARSADSTARPDASRLPRVDTLLPYTNRLPAVVAYDASRHALRCRRCENRYDPSIDGMRRAISCCGSLADVDRDDIPVCEFNLKLSPDEVEASAWSLRQLLFLQAVYNAQQRRYDPLEYDILTDSMLRLQAYVGIETAAIQALIDADLLRHDTDHPHRLYSVTPDGRDAIGESYRQGVDYGHGQGDLEESSAHVFAVDVGRRYLAVEYVENPESPVVDVVPYYEIDEQRRLDIAGSTPRATSSWLSRPSASITMCDGRSSRISTRWPIWMSMMRSGSS